VNVKNKKTSI